MIPYPRIDPIAIQIGPLAIRWYGLSYLAGILCGWWLLRTRARSDGRWSSELVDDLVFQVALGAILGGRLGYVLFYNLSGYLADPLAVFRVWEGGMSFHGGLLGALAAIGYFSHGHRRAFLEISDFLVPVVPVGLFFGRLANFINGELWGRPSDLPWAMVFPDPRAGGIPRHPSQLYEASLEGMALFALLWFYSRRPRPCGSVSGLFLAGYGCARFLVEFAREPDPQLGYLAFGWFTMGQLLSLPMVVAGVVLIWWALRGERSMQR